jgi:hypothetical protein
MATGSRVVRSETIGSYDFIAYDSEFGSDMSVEVFQHGKLIERNPMNFSNIDSQWPLLVKRHLSNPY